MPDIVSLEPVVETKKKEKKKDKKEVPPNPIVTLRNILFKVFPEPSAENNQAYEPHLSIGQFDQQKASHCLLC